MTITTKSISSGPPARTTKKLEWWGWFGVMGWLFCMINGYNELPNGYSDDNIFWCNMLFQVLFAASILAVSFRYGRAPDALGKLARRTTPVAIAITAVFTMIPQPIGPVLYVISPVFMAPAAARRIYGILRTATHGRTLFTYMSGVAASFLLLHIVIDFYEMALNYEAPTEIPFLIFAVLAFFAWLGVNRSIYIANPEPYPAKYSITKSVLFGIAALMLVAFWLRQMNNFINYAIEQYDDYLFFPVYVILPPVVFLLFGLWGDKGYEKQGIFGGLILLLITIQFVFLVSNTHSVVEIPLVFVNHFIGNYLVYYIITISINFTSHSKRPVFTASIGFVVYLAARLFNLITGEVLPESIKTADAPLFVSTAVTSIVFFLLLFFIYQRQRESTLTAALYAFVHIGSGNGSLDTPAVVNVPSSERVQDEPVDSETPNMMSAGLTQDEIKIALLLLNGETRREIYRKMNINASKVEQHVKSIRNKLNLLGDSDPRITAAAAEFKLTKREVSVLEYISIGATTEEISAGLYISAETIRYHTSNLLKKLDIKDRKDVPDWLERYKIE